MPLTILSDHGTVVLPTQYRTEDNLRPGETFEVERTKAGEYILRRKAGEKKVGSTGLLDALLACPEKGWFKPMPVEDLEEHPRSPFE